MSPRAIVLAAIVFAARAEQVRCPVVADTYLYATPWNSRGTEDAEEFANRGGEANLVTKGREHFSLLQFDLSAARGLAVEKATLRLFLRPNALRLSTMGLSTISGSGPWVEGTTRNVRAERGAANYYDARMGEQPWAYTGSDFSDVTFGLGGSLYAYVEPRSAGENWYELDIPLPILNAIVSGDQYGLAISDEKGNANGRYSFASREQSQTPPVLILEGAPSRDETPPGPVFAAEAAADARLRPGMAPLQFGGAGDDNGAGIATRYELRYSRAPIDDGNFASATPVPRWQLDPTAPKPQPLAASNSLRDEVAARVEGLEPGVTYYFAARATDEAGNVGPVSALGAHTAYTREWPQLPPATAPPPEALPGGGVWAFPDVLKVNPRTGDLLEKGAPNPVWDAAAGTVRLRAARNEFVAFQLAIPSSAPLANGQVVVAEPLFRTRLYREWFVPEGDEWYPDALVPFELPMTGNAVPGQTVYPVWVDIYVPHDAPPGTHRGRLVVRTGDPREIAVELEVLPLTLPDRLTFQVDLNGYSRVPAPGVRTGTPEYRAALHAWHRVAHEHRANLDILGYSHSGTLEPDYSPPLTGEGAETRVASWDDWDAHFGPLVSGEAFADLPRAGVPVSAIYLNLFENWPSPMAGNYRWNDFPAARTTEEYRELIRRHAFESGPVEEGFPGAYKERFTAVLRDFAEHFRRRGWTRTAYQVFFNNKHNYKDPAQGSGRGVCWWLLDEPNFRDDYRALSFFETLARPAMNDYPDVPIVFRADISYIDFMRDLLTGQVDLNVTSQRFFSRNRYLMDNRGRFGRAFWNYASPNRPRESNTLMRTWIWNVWANGGDGVVPWNTIAADNAWTRAEQLTVFYLPRFGSAGPLPSMRLRALRRGQQDAEYLALLAQKDGWDREAVENVVRAGLDGDLDALRERVARALVE